VDLRLEILSQLSFLGRASSEDLATRTQSAQAHLDVVLSNMQAEGLITQINNVWSIVNHV
jgi:hypothetical protein